MALVSDRRLAEVYGFAERAGVRTEIRQIEIRANRSPHLAREDVGNPVMPAQDAQFGMPLAHWTISRTPHFSNITASLFSRLWLACTSAHRSEEHTSELQSPVHLVCRLLLEKKKKKKTQQ